MRGAARTATALFLAMWAALGELPGGTVFAAVERTFRVNVITPETDIMSQTVKFFGDRVTTLSGGRVKFHYFWAGSLVPIANTFKGLRDGLTDLSTHALSYVSGEIADVAVLEVPFAWPLDARNMKAFQDEVNRILDVIFWRNGQVLLFANPAIMPNAISCRRGFLSREGDYKGKLIRTAGRWQGEAVKAWGARPVTIPLGDLYAALQRGTVDCTLLVYNLVESFRTYEVARYITRVDHSIQYTVLAMNREKWEQLSADEQAMFRRAAVETWDYGVRLRDVRFREVLENLARNGAEFCTPPVSEFRRLRRLAEGVWEQIRKEVSERGRQIMLIASKYREAAAERPAVGPNNPCP
jgi:TRAP-type C4-dicarboxylate transport system substrate-binding protein